MGHESHKIGFLRDELVTEDWSESTLSRVGAATSWRTLCTELGNALQIRIERGAESRELAKAANSSSMKPNIFFTPPRYAKKVSKGMFPGSVYDESGWNCGKSGHRHENALNYQF